MNVLIDGEIVLYGTVGDSFWGDGFTSMDVLEALAELGRDTDVTVRINSGGGIAWEGAAIYNALSAHRGKVTIYVDAIAASAASIIAMAGDETIMRVGSLMMIHDPASYTYGDAAEHQKSIDMLEKLAVQMASIYAEKTGESVEAMREVMRAETWLTADDAVTQKFANKSDQAQAAEVTAFDYRAYMRAPAKLTALACERNWNPKQKEPAMSDNKAKQAPAAPAAETPATAPAAPTADVRATERQRISAIMQSNEAKGREDLAAHFAYDTDIAPEAALAALAKAPTASKPEPAQTAPAAAATLAGLELATAPAAEKKPAPVINHAEIYAARR